MSDQAISDIMRDGCTSSGLSERGEECLCKSVTGSETAGVAPWGLPMRDRSTRHRCGECGHVTDPRGVCNNRSCA